MKKATASTTISFRISRQLASELTKKAIAERLSLHEYARNSFLDALAQQELRDEVGNLRSDVQEIGAAIEDLRHDLLAVLCQLLVELTDLEPEEAQRWIDSNLQG
jgi:hypothetical protein